MNQSSSYLLLGFEGTDTDLLVTFGLGGVGANVIRNFEERRYSLRNWRSWKRDEEKIPDEVIEIVEAVATRQTQDTRLDDVQRIEELTRELQLRNIELESVYFEALSAERERLIDEELKMRLQSVQRKRAGAIIAMLVMAE